MLLSLIYIVLTTFAISNEAQERGPVFLMEPPVQLLFANGTGAKVSCATHGFPEPQITWIQSDGSNVENIPGLRSALDNGTLLFHPFSASQYRQDVHSAIYRCKASNIHGTIVSRDMRIQAAIWQDWDVRILTNGNPEIGGPALLSCIIPYSIKEHASFAAWYRNDQVLLPTVDDTSSRYQIINDGWSLIIRNIREDDSHSQYACSVLDIITGERKRSTATRFEIRRVIEASAPKPLIHTVWEVKVKRGMDATLPCLVNGNPLPTINWYRETRDGSLTEVQTSTSGRIVRSLDILTVRRAEPTDSGRWACRADNLHGHTMVYVQLSVQAPLRVSVAPQLQVVNSGGTAYINCSYSGWPAPKLEWLHNAVPLAGVGNGPGSRIRMYEGGTQLAISSIYRGDKGIYQCLVKNDWDSAQASSELRLGDTSPEMQYTFIEQVLRPSQLVTLKCSATGSPSPHITWLLDMQPLKSFDKGNRYIIDQYTSSNNEVIGNLNISNVRSDDGGLYTCRATNALGEVSHTARLNIYGPPYIRSIGPVRAVAGRELVLYCPYSGYPISNVKWERDGSSIDNDPNLLPRPTDGALHIMKVLASHAGTYTCIVTGNRGETAKRDVQILVSNPPEIEPFSFSSNLQEGKRAQVSCSVISGDMPVDFKWYKDNMPIPATLQVEERGADFFSNLVFKEVSSQHSGIYTCIASNSAAKANFSTELIVKVPPKWITEPIDVSVRSGESLALHCQTRGAPTPQIIWSKQRSRGGDFIPIINLGGRFQFISNGSLWIETASSYDEGHYMCKATNGVGNDLSKTIFVSVNEPPRFEMASKNVTARRDTSATLLCDVHGDEPLQVMWTHNMNRLDLNTYRISHSEVKTDTGLKSQIVIVRTDRQDSGVYKCQAINSYGQSNHYIYFSVLEKPDPPHSVKVAQITSRSVKISWVQGFDGNSPLVGFNVQYQILDPSQSVILRSNSWDNAITVNISLHSSTIGNGLNNRVTVTSVMNHFEALVSNLRPHTTYMIRLLAMNQIDESAYTEPVIVKTNEEAPSEPPQNVQLSAGAPGELHVSWRSPSRDSWNGDLLGYTIRCKSLTEDNHTRTLTVNGLAASELIITGLRKYTRYEVTVSAFNGVASGPPSNPVTATTLEGVPEAPPTRISCVPLSSVSIKVYWSPPPPAMHGGFIQGYKLIYTPMSSNNMDIHISEVKRVTITESYLQALNKFTNYSIQVLAFTNAGDGVKSAPIYCKTEEDVPSPPQKIKAVAMTFSSVLVSWMEPLNPNGILSHYTVYHREAGRIGKHSRVTVSVDKLQDNELMYEIRNLVEHKLYEFWVSATTGSGEGEPTTVVAQSPNSRAAARIASFGTTIRSGIGSRLNLLCAAAGHPVPRTRWTHRLTPVTHHNLYSVTTRGHLLINELTQESSGNFTCTAVNIYGEDSITYTVLVILPPKPPTLNLLYTTTTSIKVQWQMYKTSSEAMFLGYQLYYKEDKESNWRITDLTPNNNTYILEGLKCGSKYNIKIRAKNSVAVGPFGDVLFASTRGSTPKQPKKENMFITNSTAIKVNYYSWRDGGCPLLGFLTEYRKAGSDEWLKLPEHSGASSVVIGDLLPGQWYEVKTIASNEAGITEVKAFIDTLKLDGGRIAQLEPIFSLKDGGVTSGATATLILSAVATSFIIISVLTIAICFLRERKRCASKNRYLRDDTKLSESHDEETDKLQGGQKLYSSSSINGNEKCTDNSSDIYEISPYATFGVAGSVGGGVSVNSSNSGSVGAAHSFHLRTFARHEDNDALPPPRRHRRRACDHYRYDESSLSKSSTVEARHRLSVWPLQYTDDSDENSDSPANTTCKGSPSGTYLPSHRSGRGSSRYQKREEQDRRDCTIHV